MFPEFIKKDLIEKFTELLDTPNTLTVGSMFYVDSDLTLSLLEEPANELLTYRIIYDFDNSKPAWGVVPAIVSTEYDIYTYRADKSGTQTSGGAFATVLFDTAGADSGDITYNGGEFTVNKTAVYEITYGVAFTWSSGSGGGVGIYDLQDDSSGSYATIDGSGDRDQYLGSSGASGSVGKKVIVNLSNGDKFKLRFKDVGNPHTIQANECSIAVRTISNGQA